MSTGGEITRDEIIKMAQEAGAEEHYVNETDDIPWSIEFSLHNLEAFAAIVEKHSIKSEPPAFTTELTKAILAAGAELGEVHDFLFEGYDRPCETDSFVKVLEKHLEPLISPDYRATQIAILEAQLAALKTQ